MQPAMASLVILSVVAAAARAGLVLPLAADGRAGGDGVQRGKVVSHEKYQGHHGARTSSGRTSSAMRLGAHKERPAFLAAAHHAAEMGAGAANASTAADSSANLLTTASAVVIPASTVPKVKHSKEAGGGYKEGSPLYAKQEAMKKLESKGEPTTSELTSDEVFEDFMKNITNEYDVSDFVAAMTGNGTQEQEEHAWEWFYGAVISQTAYVLLVVIAAYLYRMRSPELRAPGGLESTEEWAYGLCSCQDIGEDAKICGLAYCCPAIRWADTMSNEKVARLSFWQGLALMLFLVFLGPFTGEISLWVLLGVCVYYRQQLRKIFGHSPWSAESCCYDILTYCCCSCCAIVQEAREVEKVRRAQF